MNDALLEKYNAELAFIRGMGAEFAEAYPSQATNLGLGAEGENDPFVGRMIEAFALLNARTRLKLEDGFPELCGSVLEVLYPHYRLPLPSMAVVEFRLGEDHADMVDGHPIAAGRELLSEPVEGHRCRYRTCYDTVCWPIRITAADYHGAPVAAPSTRFTAGAVACLSLRVAGFEGGAPLASLGCRRLRFFITAQAPFNFQLHEHLFRDLIGVVVTDDRSDPSLQCLPPSCVQPVGFAESEAVLPTLPRSHAAYRLLTEFFAYRPKYLFFDLVLDDGFGVASGDTASVHLLFGRHRPQLEQPVEAATLRLGCSPVVNLYDTRAEQLRVDHRRSEYPLVVDSRRPDAHEVYSIDRVTGVDASGEAHPLPPFYAVHGFETQEDPPALWHAQRRDRIGGGLANGGSDLHLSFVDLGFRSRPLREWSIDAQVVCLNRDLPNGMPTGPGRPRFEFDGGDLASPHCLIAPTPTIRPPLSDESLWRLLSHLNLNHLSLAGDGAVESLRELLRLYDHQNTAATRQQISGVVGLEMRRAVKLVAGPSGSVPCRGMTVQLTLDDEQFRDGSAFLLASVLDRFFALYSGINSFTQTTLRSAESEQEPFTWPARIGNQMLL